MCNILIGFIMFFFTITPIVAQVSRILGEPFPEKPPRSMFYSSYYESVREELFNSSKKHASYSFILSNASTPGLDLLSFLPDEDRTYLLDKVPPDEDIIRSVIIEYVLAAMAENSRKLEALTAIWGGKAKSLKNVVTLGK